MLKESPNPGTEFRKELPHEHELILFNDDINTIDFVIQALVDVLEHDLHQAEQCALITHFNGQCSVKKGDWETLSDKHQIMSDLGLMVKIL